MRILIIQNIKDSPDICHLENDGSYVQYIDPSKGKPEDVGSVKWDVAVISKETKLSKKAMLDWYDAIRKSSKHIVLA